jgi:hypothetical protein
LANRGLDAAIGRNFFEFHHVGLTWGEFGHKIDPVEWGA